MQFLRTLFWVVVAVAAVVFSIRNWTAVPVRLFGNIQADAKLPVLIFGAFLIGVIPTWIMLRATRWRLKRRLEAAERSLAELRSPTLPPADPIAPPVEGFSIPTVAP